MNEASRVRGFVRIVVGLNLVVLLTLFAGPRYFFMAKNWGMEREDVLRLKGVWDLPNIYQASYILAEAIRLETPKNATLFLPQGEGAGMAPVALLKTLLPRRLYFEGTPGYAEGILRPGKINRSWKVISGREGGDCRNKPMQPLGDTGYWICRLDR